MFDNNETHDDIVTDEVDASYEDDLETDLKKTVGEVREQQSASPGDTAEYLDALEGGHASGDWNFTPSRETSAFYDVVRYHNQERRRRRKSVLRIVAIIFAILIVVGSAGVGMFVANINARLSENVTEELREQLAQPKEPDDPFYMLLLGVDKDQGRVDDVDNYGADESAYRSDSIMLCRIDPKNVKVTMVSIHRDTLVDLGEYGDQKINAAYSIGGAAYATEVVSTFADVPITHYAEIDLDRFISIVDVIGGVTVNLPVPVYDPEYTELDLPAGVQTLNGTQAALLCRCRHGYDAYGDGDRFRAANQRMVFSEIIKKVLASDPMTISSTITTMADSVTCDMDIAKILDLASQMMSLNADTDIMTGMEPTDGVLINDTWYEICLVDQWKKMMTRVDQGLPPYDENEGEHDSTAGIAGGVGEEGERAAEAAVANDATEAVAAANGDYSGYGGNDSTGDEGGYGYTYYDYGYTDSTGYTDYTEYTDYTGSDYDAGETQDYGTGEGETGDEGAYAESYDYEGEY